MWYIAAFPRVAASIKTATGFEDHSIWQVWCKISCFVGIRLLSDVRDEFSRITERLRQRERGPFPHQATPISHTCYVSPPREGRVATST